MTKHRLAMWAGVVGVSLLAPYALAVAASRWPNSPVGTFNRTLHTAEAQA